MDAHVQHRLPRTETVHRDEARPSGGGNDDVRVPAQGRYVPGAGVAHGNGGVAALEQQGGGLAHHQAAAHHHRPAARRVHAVIVQQLQAGLGRAGGEAAPAGQKSRQGAGGHAVHVLVRGQKPPGGFLRRLVRQGTQQQAAVDGGIIVHGPDDLRQGGGVIQGDAAQVDAALGAAGGRALFIGQAAGVPAHPDDGQGGGHAPLPQDVGPGLQVLGQALRHGSARKKFSHRGSPRFAYSPENRRISRETGV